MRRILSLFLAVVLIFSLALPAMAATVKQEVSAEQIAPGDQVTVTVSLDEAVQNVVMYQYYLYYNKDLFSLASSTGSATVSNALSNAKGDYYMISMVDTTSMGVTVEAGTLAALTFTALDTLTEAQTGDFLLEKVYMMTPDYTAVEGVDTENESLSITVAPAASEYTVTLPQGEGYTVTPSEGSTSPVAEGGSYSFAITVAEGYEGTPVVKANGTELKEENGVYTVSDIREDQVITVEGVSLKINTYMVTLPQGEGYTVTPSEDSVSPVAEGGSYSFTVAVDTDNYEGTPVVKANGVELKEENGVYTLSDIREDQVVTLEGISLKPNTYKVTLPEAPVGYALKAAQGSVSPVTEGGSYSFTLSLNIGYEGTPVVKANGVELTAVEGLYTIENIQADQVVTVEGIAAKDDTYTVAASSDVTAVKGDNVVVSVQVTGNSDSEITSYNDYDVTLTYDPAALNYVSAEAAHTGAEITADAGTIRIVGHGDAKTYSNAVVTLNFTAAASGEHTVTISSAKIDNSGNAIALDAPNAALSDAATLVKVAYPVTLPENFTGELTVLPGGDYRFTAPNDCYAITVTVGGETVAPEVDGLAYTVRNVNGDVVIKAVGKTYNVVKNASGAAITGEDTAQHGADYSFTVTADAGFAITGVSVEIGGNSVDYSISGGSYIVSGSDITGDMTITVTAQQQAVNTTQITFEGVDASEVQGGLVQYAPNGQDFTFQLNEEEGYVYTAKLGEAELQCAEGVYTIPGSQINGTALIVTITKELDSFAPDVKVSQYLQLDGTAMWLVTATEENAVLDWGEAGTMFWSEKYNTYCWLVISTGTEAEVKQQAENAICAAEENAVAVQISYDLDVNQTGTVDINDAQLTYDMYQAKLYAGFGTVSMDKFLEADTNGDAVVNVEDAAAVVAQILK